MFTKIKMIQFWLDDFMDLFKLSNFNLDGSGSQDYIKILNIIALISIIAGISASIITKKSYYFAITVLVLSFTILIKSNINTSLFTPVDNNTVNGYDTGVYLVRAANKNDNLLYVNSVNNFNKGDILVLNYLNKNLETCIISDIQYTKETDGTGNIIPVIVLLSNIKNNYSKYTTKILKVSDSSPNIITPPDANTSIQGAGAGFNSDPINMALERNSHYKPDLPNADRNDWNLELSSMGIPGMKDSYRYQGQPYGNLKCRNSNTSNPMGTIEVPEYDNAPTMYGTCNEGEIGPNGILNNTFMTENQEATVSQRVDDLLFHKGNAQSRFSPVSVDTLPNNQEAFAHWCYRSPTNLVNVKYGSIFVNDPEKFKLVTKLARASGTENGGGGGR